MELVVAMAILALVILPLSYGFFQEAKMARAYYHRALAMQIVDGEMEILTAGQWRAFPPGVHPYPVDMRSATNLPAGRFLLTIQPPRIRLVWQPDGKGTVGIVAREVILPEPRSDPGAGSQE
jgi:hypothetical protein